MKTCGDAGGRTKDGSPCGRKRVKGNLCAHHDDTRQTADDARRGTVKSEFLRIYAKGHLTLKQAAKKAGASAPTIWRLRREYPEFDVEVTALAGSIDRIGLQIAEDTLRNRIFTDKCTTAELIFYLVNRGRGRWRNVHHLRHAGPDGAPLPAAAPGQVVNIYLPHNDRDELPKVIQQRMSGNSGAAD